MFWTTVQQHKASKAVVVLGSIGREEKRRRHTRDIGENGVGRVVKSKPALEVLTVDLVGLLSFREERGDGG